MDIEKIIEVVKLVRHWIDNKDIVEVNINEAHHILRINDIASMMIDLNDDDATYFILNTHLVSITSTSIHIEKSLNFKIKFSDIEMAYPLTIAEYNEKIDKVLNSLNIRYVR